MIASTGITRILAVVALVSHLVAVPSIEAGGRRVGYCTVCSPVCVTYPTILRAGQDPEDLQVHVVGRTFDTVELYFREEFHRETLPQANLHCGRVSLAPRNDLGTFAILLGGCQDTLAVYGWKRGEFVPTRAEFTPAPGRPLNLRWVTPRILKATYGDGKELILRFNDSDEGWSTLHSDAP